MRMTNTVALTTRPFGLTMVGFSGVLRHCAKCGKNVPILACQICNVVTVAVVLLWEGTIATYIAFSFCLRHLSILVIPERQANSDIFVRITMAWSPPFSHDGFTSAYGRFKTERGGFERKDGMFLRSLFLPKLSPDGEIAVQDPDFVYAQLKHYGVQYPKKEFRGRGTSLIQRCLRDGQFDEVPQSMLDLQTRMHREWIKKCPAAQLADHPQWIIIKYFGSLTEPDHTVTTVVEIPFPPASQYGVNRMRETASHVPGLHHQIATGRMTKAVFLGWDKDAVDKAASEYPAKEKAQVLSPVGSYVLVECDQIKDHVMPNLWKYLRLNIFPTAKAGTFKAEFYFKLVQGVMVICADRAAIEDYAFQESDGGNQNVGPRAGAGGSLPSENLTYYLKTSVFETATRRITNSPNIGTICFNDAEFTGFVGVADLSKLGQEVVFTATKDSETPGAAGQE